MKCIELGGQVGDFGKCIHLYNHYPNQDTAYFQQPRKLSRVHFWSVPTN